LKLIKELLGKADKIKKPVFLKVLKANEKAKKLYFRLGFSIKEESETHFKMTYKKYFYLLFNYSKNNLNLINLVNCIV